VRTHHSPSAGGLVSSPIKPIQGGTGAVSATQALQALSAVPVSQLNTANGLAAFDAKNRIQASHIPSTGPAPVGIRGPGRILTNNTSIYHITNYDSYIDYTITSSVGTVRRQKDNIYLTLGSTPGPVVLTVNGREHNILAVNTSPVRPTLKGSTGGAIGNIYGYFTSSDYSNLSGTAEHLSSDWQISTDPSFKRLVARATRDEENKTAWSVNVLAPSTRYYARVRHRDDQDTVSTWSPVYEFTTGSSYTLRRETAKLLPDPSNQGDAFAYSGPTLDTHGRYMAAGSPLKSGTLTNQGQLFIYKRNGLFWRQIHAIIPGDTSLGDKFGTSVVMSANGNRLAVSAPFKTIAETNQGAVYIYSRNGDNWTQEVRLTASDAFPFDRFGECVSLSKDGNRLVVGSPGRSGEAGNNQGAIYIFDRNQSGQWVQTTSLRASDPTSGDQFGLVCSISELGTRIMASSIYKDVGRGAVYSFVLSNGVWSQEAKIVAPDATSESHFGTSIAMDAESRKLVISSPRSNSYTGAVYTFIREGSTWSPGTKLTAADGVTSDRFGNKVSMTSRGDRIAVQASGLLYERGGVYMYVDVNGSWVQEMKLSSSDGVAGDNFGNCHLQADGSSLFCGAWNKNSAQGALYVFN
jgi:hypothetical protein